jgi:hypothetical protein
MTKRFENELGHNISSSATSRKLYSSPRIRSESILEAGLTPTCGGINGKGGTSNGMGEGGSPDKETGAGSHPSLGNRKSAFPCKALKT